MKACQRVYEVLEKLDIDFEVVEHEAADTMEAADAFIEGMIGIRTKTLFMCNKKKTAYYLLVMEGTKRLDIKRFAELAGEKGMSFCSEEKLQEKMKLKPGEVSLFGILNNTDKDIKVFFDKEMLSQDIITFHPNDNTKTIFISIGNMFKFLDETGYKYSITVC